MSAPLIEAELFPTGADVRTAFWASASGISRAWLFVTLPPAPTETFPPSVIALPPSVKAPAPAAKARLVTVASVRSLVGVRRVLPAKMSEAGSVGAVSPAQFAAVLHKASSPSPSHVSAAHTVGARSKTNSGALHFVAFRCRDIMTPRA